MYIYLNGNFIEKNKAVISPFDHGYLYGLGVFETFRTYNRHPFLLDDHLKRLNKGLNELNIHKQFEREEVQSIVKKLSKQNDLTNSYIRFNLSSGIGEIGLETEPYECPTVIMFQKPLSPVPPLREKEAVLLKIPRNTPETQIRLKSHHFLNNAIAKREIGADPNKEGIFLTREGFLAEGITSNLFWVKNDTLYTPTIATGILDGITRRFVIDIAGQAGMLLEEGFFQKNVLQEADEIFFTNSIQEIVPVNRFNAKKYPGKDGPYVMKLNHLYQKYVNHRWSIKD